MMGHNFVQRSIPSIKSQVDDTFNIMLDYPFDTSCSEVSILPEKHLPDCEMFRYMAHRGDERVLL